MSLAKVKPEGSVEQRESGAMVLLASWRCMRNLDTMMAAIL